MNGPITLDGLSTCPLCGAEVAMLSFGPKMKAGLHRTWALQLDCRRGMEARLREAGIDPWSYPAEAFR